MSLRSNIFSTTPAFVHFLLHLLLTLTVSVLLPNLLLFILTFSDWQFLLRVTWRLQRVPTLPAPSDSVSAEVWSVTNLYFDPTFQQPGVFMIPCATKKSVFYDLEVRKNTCRESVWKMPQIILYIHVFMRFLFFYMELSFSCDCLCNFVSLTRLY